MRLMKCLFTENECYKSGRTITPKGIVVHSTGANNPNLRRYVQPDDGILGKNVGNTHWNQFRPGGNQVCVHAFIGKLKDGSIATYQTLPWNMRGWHAGSGKKGSVNNTHIGFEICEDGLNDKVYFDKVYKEAVELTAYLCKKYNIEVNERTVLCHSEAHKLGLASNHADVMHWFPRHGKDMNTFRKDVIEMLNTNNTEVRYKTLEDIPNYGKATIKKLMDKGYLSGTNSDKGLDISKDMLRVFIINDRAGLYDR